MTEVEQATNGPAPGLALYQLEKQLTELIEFREEARTDEEKAAADLLIEGYVQAEVKKVDGILAYMRTCAQHSAAALGEAERLAKIGREWARRKERLETATLNAMLSFGTKSLDGTLGRFTVATNPASVEVTDQSLVPREYQTASVQMPADVWLELCAFLRKFRVVVDSLAGPELEANFPFGAAEFSIRKADIAKRLKSTESCQHCDGSGQPYCPECEGTGRVGLRVPGARLIADKCRLVVK